MKFYKHNVQKQMNKLVNVMVLHIFNTDTQSLSSGDNPQFRAYWYCHHHIVSGKSHKFIEEKLKGFPPKHIQTIKSH